MRRLPKALFGIIFCFAGMLGLSIWQFYEVRDATLERNGRWAARATKAIESEWAQWERYIARQSGRQASDLSSLGRSRAAISALTIRDTKSRYAPRWQRDSFAGDLTTIDPRLGAAHLKALERRETVRGPLLAYNGQPYATVVKPLTSSRVLIAYISLATLWQDLQEETRLYHLRAGLFDREGRLLFASGDLSMVDRKIERAQQRIIKGKNQGAMVLAARDTWQWFGSYRHDPGTGLTVITLQWAAWVYLPLFFFIIAFGALLLLVRTPIRESLALRHQWFRRELKGFASKVDRFIRGRSPVMVEAPADLPELAPVVYALRWMMPQWKKAADFPKDLVLERKLLAMLVETLPEGILFFNTQGQMQVSNELGRVFLSLNTEPGKEYKVVNGVQISRGFLEPFAEPVFTNEQTNLGKEVEVKWADGKHLYRVWVERVEGEPGETLGFIIVVRDITFRKNWEYVQEQVLSGITHDLRGPLSAVMGYLDLLKRQLIKDNGSQKANDYVRLAREGAVRLSQMVNDILDVVRFEQGKIDLSLESFPVADLFQRLMNTFGVTAEQKKVVLKMTIDGPATLQATGDRKMLERVFDNLVSNAIKFTPPEGQITVTARPGPARVSFEVFDTGRGIPREAQSRIFDKFQQVRPGDRSGGYGLGLAVTKFIIEAHHGEIRVESEVGQGSRFNFWLPDSQPGEAVMPPPEEPAEIRPLGEGVPRGTPTPAAPASTNDDALDLEPKRGGLPQVPR